MRNRLEIPGHAPGGRCRVATRNGDENGKRQAAAQATHFG